MNWEIGKKKIVLTSEPLILVQAIDFITGGAYGLAIHMPNTKPPIAPKPNPTHMKNILFRQTKLEKPLT